MPLPLPPRLAESPEVELGHRKEPRKSLDRKNLVGLFFFGNWREATFSTQRPLARRLDKLFLLHFNPDLFFFLPPIAPSNDEKMELPLASALAGALLLLALAAFFVRRAAGGKSLLLAGKQAKGGLRVDATSGDGANAKAALDIYRGYCSALDLDCSKLIVIGEPA